MAEIGAGASEQLLARTQLQHRSHCGICSLVHSVRRIGRDKGEVSAVANDSRTDTETVN